jgi:uncharacterized repeat protein (TIGR01451 family)
MTHHPSRVLSSNGLALLGAVLFGLLVCVGAPSFAAAPPAGTSIGNQASATYTDGSGITRTTTSNPVYTLVQQVGAIALTDGTSTYVSAGGSVVFPHTVTNAGNGTDTFALTAVDSAGDNFNYTSITIYADANGDGVPDNTTPITVSPALAAGESFSFVVVAVAPVTVSNGQTGLVDVTATSNFDNTKTVTKTNTGTVTSNAVVTVTKAISIGTANSGATPTTGITYTLTYKNSGNAAATAVTLTDTVPAGLTYVGASGLWSGSVTSLTDAAGGDPAGITYQYVGGVVTAVVANVPAGGAGTVSFKVDVNASLPAQTIKNTCPFSYNNGAAVVNGTSNTVNLLITQYAGVTFTGPAAVPTANQGATVTFDNTVTNTGNGTDTFNITQVAGNSFPAGTTFVFYQADGQTPLMDSNNDGVPDTGPLAPGAAYHVFVKATLPPGVSGVGPYVFQKTATSTVDPTKSATATDTLNAITPATVDLTNDTVGAAAPGFGAGPEAASQKTNTTNPGTVTRFSLFVANTSAIGDTYALQASTDNTFAAVTLPNGWAVTFRDTTGAVVTNTGIIVSGANKEFYADVMVPANATPGTTDIFFKVSSQATNANDRLHDAVTVNTVRNISLTPNNTGQLFAGNTVVFTHTIVNLGNVTEGDGAGSTVSLAVSDSFTGFTSVVYWDKNNNGELDPDDPTVTSLAQLVGGTNGASTAAGLNPAESATLFVKVYSPAGATAGVTDTATLTATTVGVISGVPAPAVQTVKDNAVVIAGDLKIEKWQALDADLNGTPDAAYTQVTLNAVPGQGLRYKVVVTNLGTADATNVKISDATPQYTTYHAGDGAKGATGTASFSLDGGTTFSDATAAPAAGAAGTIVVDLGATPLKPNQTVIIYFGVKVNE